MLWGCFWNALEGFRSILLTAVANLMFRAYFCVYLCDSMLKHYSLGLAAPGDS